jgi:lysozyme
MIRGVDVASFQGEPGHWQAAAGPISWAAVKLTELSPKTGLYIDPDAADDWAWLGRQGHGRIAYLFGHPATPVAATVAAFAAELGRLGLAAGDGVALDHETTDGLGPAAVAAWGREVLATMQATFLRAPLLYANRAFLAEGYCAGMQHCPLWISDPDHPAGAPHLPEPFTAWAIHQYGITGSIDRDIATWPTVAAMQAAVGRTARKPAQRREPEMIMVQVNRTEVPKGTEWPGVFLLDSAAGLHHVTSTPDVDAYKAAGVPGPVTISWAEYSARVKAAAPATA